MQLLAPFQPLAMKSFFCPIDPRLNFQEANRVLDSLRVPTVVTAGVYLEPSLRSVGQYGGPATEKGLSTTLVNAHGTVVDIDGGYVAVEVRQTLVDGVLAPALAQSLMAVDLGGGVSACGVTASLCDRDYAYVLESPSTVGTAHSSAGPFSNTGSAAVVLSPLLWGHLSVQQTIQALSQVCCCCCFNTSV
jgi:integrator complex subunit 9